MWIQEDKRTYLDDSQLCPNEHITDVSHFTLFFFLAKKYLKVNKNKKYKTTAKLNKTKLSQANTANKTKKTKTTNKNKIKNKNKRLNYTLKERRESLIVVQPHSGISSPEGNGKALKNVLGRVCCTSSPTNGLP